VNPPPIETWVLTGYLGAGKTTLLNHLLGLPMFAGRPTALLINEFGTLGVDGMLVREGDHAKYEINRGSLFCACTKVELLNALADIAEKLRPRVLLIEATGVAEPADLEQVIGLPSLAERFNVRANVCMVDAGGFAKVAAFLQAASRQVRAADGIVINKTDQISPGEVDRLAKLLAELNPRAPRTRTSFARVEESFLLGLEHEPRGEAPAEGPPPVAAASIRGEGPVNREAFAEAVAALGEKLLRLKGHVDFGQGPVFVELAGGALQTRAAEPGAAGTAFTAIAWRMTREELEKAFAPRTLSKRR